MFKNDEQLTYELKSKNTGSGVYLILMIISGVLVDTVDAKGWEI